MLFSSDVEQAGWQVPHQISRPSVHEHRLASLHVVLVDEEHHGQEVRATIGPEVGRRGNVIPNLARRARLMLLVDLYCEVGKGSSKRPPKKDLPFPFLSTLSASDRSEQNLAGLAISTSPPSNKSSKSAVPPLPHDASSSSSSTGLAQFSSSHVPPPPAAPPPAAFPPSFDDSSFTFSHALA